nr:MAG TPA: hypothetical protein [Caudoviricetes sp.]
MQQWFDSPIYQQIKTIQAAYNQIVPTELQDKLKRIQAQHKQHIPASLSKQTRELHRLLNTFPIEGVHLWQQHLEKSDNPEDFALFYTPAYAEIEKRVEKGNATPLEQEITKVGRWAKAKGKAKDGVMVTFAVIGVINTTTDFVERIIQLIEFITKSTG